MKTQKLILYESAESIERFRKALIFVGARMERFAKRYRSVMDALLTFRIRKALIRILIALFTAAMILLFAGCAPIEAQADVDVIAKAKAELEADLSLWKMETEMKLEKHVSQTVGNISDGVGTINIDGGVITSIVAIVVIVLMLIYMAWKHQPKRKEVR